MADKTNNFENVISSLLEGAQGVLTSKTVVGKPVQVGDTILIPLSDVTVGACAGANNGDKKNAGAGGFSAKMSPSAVLIIRNGNTKVVSIKDQTAVSRLIDLVPETIDKFMAKRTESQMMDGDEAVDLAFGEKEKKEETDAK